MKTLQKTGVVILGTHDVTVKGVIKKGFVKKG